MDDQHDCPNDNAPEAEKLPPILLQLTEAGRREVYALVRDLAADCDRTEQATTVAVLFGQWKDLWRQADAAPDDAAMTAIAHRAIPIEQRAVALPLTSARDVLAPIVMTTDASNEPARLAQDALVAPGPAHKRGRKAQVLPGLAPAFPQQARSVRACTRERGPETVSSCSCSTYPRANSFFHCSKRRLRDRAANRAAERPVGLASHASR